MRDDLYKRLLALLIAVVTVITTLVAFLQSDAGNRDDRAGRDATRLAIELIGRRVNGETQVNFDYDEAYQNYLEMDALAFAAENRGDIAASDRYQILKESFVKLSPIMQPPYFDAADGTVDYNRYVADVYLTDVTRMNEEYTAAAAVKDGWDTKANTYIVHLTILAVSLFLLGLAATIEISTPRLIFTVVGISMAVVASLWALSTFLTPVFDLRDYPDVIGAYVQGTIQNESEQPQAAVESYNKALATVPDYAAAYVGRSDAYANAGDYEAAIGDLKQARSLGVETASVVGQQAWLEYLVGRFDESVATGRAALEQYPDASELWIRFDVALALLAKGEAESAQAEYQQAMDIATQAVSDAQNRGEPVSPSLWWSLTTGADDILNLEFVAQSGEGEPSPAALPDKAVILQTAPVLVNRLRNLAVSLEFYGRPPGEASTATIENLAFGSPVYGDDGSFIDHEIADEFVYGVTEMDALFDYSGMQDGQELLVKVYINGQEDASWRKMVTWQDGADGTFTLPLAIAYSDTFVLSSGIYFVEFYVDGQIAGEGSFVVLEPD